MGFPCGCIHVGFTSVQETGAGRAQYIRVFVVLSATLQLACGLSAKTVPQVAVKMPHLAHFAESLEYLFFFLFLLFYKEIEIKKRKMDATENRPFSKKGCHKCYCKPVAKPWQISRQSASGQNNDDGLEQQSSSKRTGQSVTLH
ncbi:hypothetical protein ACWJJH_04565 [Endozoicomonadaceae bacterium StTr2]